MEDYIMLSKLLLLPPRWLNQLPGLGSVYLGAVCTSSVFLLSSICHFWNMSICTREHVYTFSSSWISLTKTNVAVTPLLWGYHEMMKWCRTSREGAGPVQGADPGVSRVGWDMTCPRNWFSDQQGSCRTCPRCWSLDQQGGAWPVQGAGAWVRAVQGPEFRISWAL